MAIPFVTPTKVVGVTGDAILVQVLPVAGVPNELELHITRRGRAEIRFSRAELSNVLTEVNRLATMTFAIPGPEARK